MYIIRMSEFEIVRPMTDKASSSDHSLNVKEKSEEKVEDLVELELPLKNLGCRSKCITIDKDDDLEDDLVNQQRKSLPEVSLIQSRVHPKSHSLPQLMDSNFRRSTVRRKHGVVIFNAPDFLHDSDILRGERNLNYQNSEPLLPTNDQLDESSRQEDDFEMDGVTQFPRAKTGANRQRKSTPIPQMTTTICSHQ